MIIHKCDRCKKELEWGTSKNNQVTTGNVIKTHYELCDNCMKELGKFLSSINAILKLGTDHDNEIDDIK